MRKLQYNRRVQGKITKERLPIEKEQPLQKDWRHLLIA